MVFVLYLFVPFRAQRNRIKQSFFDHFSAKTAWDCGAQKTRKNPKYKEKCYANVMQALGKYRISLFRARWLNFTDVLIFSWLKAKYYVVIDLR